MNWVEAHDDLSMKIKIIDLDASPSRVYAPAVLCDGLNTSSDGAKWGYITNYTQLSGVVTSLPYTCQAVRAS